MPNNPSTSILVVGIPTAKEMGQAVQQFYGGYHRILAPLKAKIMVSDTCYLLDSDEGAPYIAKVMDYCVQFSRTGELPFPVLLAELSDSPVTSIRLPLEATEWLLARGIRLRQGAI